uniref:Uncharacterized protein n=1 Tax=Ignisphaera aggregans TaxID=334771 RepID=A0A7J3JQY6_9CREN
MEEEILNKILHIRGVSGYSLNGEVLTIYVEDEETKKTLALPNEVQKFKVEIVVTGRFVPL